jgi:large subunit ribosomal protein L10
MNREAPEVKKKIVEELANLMIEYPIIGIVDMENMPTPQLQNMREQLRETVVLRMTKKRLIRLALKKAESKKKGIAVLDEKMKGMPALLFTKENPFKLYKKLQKNKSTAPAKAGQIAPKDVLVQAGPTPFAPGPIIGELGSIGIKAGIDGGKVAIKEDKVVVKEGEEIKANVAALLTRLKIEPMEVGLDLVATYEDGTIFTKSVLDVDEKKYVQDLQNCASWAFNLAMESGFPTAETITLMVTKAFSEAKGLAMEADVLTDITAIDILAKAERQAGSLNSQLDIKPVEKKKEEAKPASEEEPKQEEKKKEEEKADNQDSGDNGGQ